MAAMAWRHGVCLALGSVALASAQQVPAVCSGTTQADFDACNQYTDQLMSQLKQGAAQAQAGLQRANELTAQMNKLLSGAGLSSLSVPESHPQLVRSSEGKTLYPVNGYISGELTNSFHVPGANMDLWTMPPGFGDSFTNFGGSDATTARRLNACTDGSDAGLCTQFCDSVKSTFEGAKLAMDASKAKVEAMIPQLQEKLGNIGLSATGGMAHSFPNSNDFSQSGIDAVKRMFGSKGKSVLAEVGSKFATKVEGLHAGSLRRRLGTAECHTVGPLSQGPVGSMNTTCWQHVNWARSSGTFHPDMFPNLTTTDDDATIQLALYQLQKTSADRTDLVSLINCPMPCPQEYVNISYTILTEDPNATAAQIGALSNDEVGMLVERELKALGKDYGFRTFSQWSAVPDQPYALVSEYSGRRGFWRIGTELWPWVLALCILGGIGAFLVDKRRKKKKASKDGKKKKDRSGKKVAEKALLPAAASAAAASQQIAASPSAALAPGSPGRQSSRVILRTDQIRYVQVPSQKGGGGSPRQQQE